MNNHFSECEIWSDVPKEIGRTARTTQIAINEKGEITRFYLDSEIPSE